ncbi:RidA family protein [Streptomyces sp. NPDC048604]|uniref:RidA family protein n=1 Tax=Streptomyces sp. NPDC048604 TaxID=3365578 RepID=UPI00371A958E
MPTPTAVAGAPDWYAPTRISLGIRVGDLVFTSGQAPVDDSGSTVAPGDFAAQARQAMAHVADVLTRAGSGPERLVKVTVFVTDIAHQDLFAAVRDEWYPTPFPAESFVQVAALADPRWLVEIEAIGAVG